MNRFSAAAIAERLLKRCNPITDRDSRKKLIKTFRSRSCVLIVQEKLNSSSLGRTTSGVWQWSNVDNLGHCDACTVDGTDC